jgi:hypothetical protein
MNLKQSFLILLAFGIATSFYSCDDDDVISKTESDVSFNFEYALGGEDFAYDQVYDLNGTKVSFQAVQFYVGGIKLYPEEGDAVTVDGKYLLVKPNSGPQEVVTVEKKHYHMAAFFVGVDAEDNDQTEDDFDSRSADDPLARQLDVPMHWNWNSGYIFVRVDAIVDLDGDDQPETPMEYHLGTNNFKRDISLLIHTDVDEDAQAITFGFDVAELFTGLDLTENYSMHTGDDPASAVIFANNIANAITKK